MSLALRPIGQNDYSVIEDGERIGPDPVRLRARSPGVWLWNVIVHIPGPPIGTAPDLETAKARFKEAWLAFKTRHGPEQLAEAFRAMHIRDDG
jgi:hypothetical protein